MVTQRNNTRMLISCKRLKNIQAGVSVFFFFGNISLLIVLWASAVLRDIRFIGSLNFLHSSHIGRTVL